MSALELSLTYSSDINYLVMDYLVTNGYPAAAKKFALEANIQPKSDMDSIQERVDIRTAIHSGDIRSAIEKINELNPQVRTSDFIVLPRTLPLLGLYQFHAPLIIPSQGLMKNKHLQSSV